MGLGSKDVSITTMRQSEWIMYFGEFFIKGMFFSPFLGRKSGLWNDIVIV